MFFSFPQDFKEKQFKPGAMNHFFWGDTVLISRVTLEPNRDFGIAIHPYEVSRLHRRESRAAYTSLSAKNTSLRPHRSVRFHGVRWTSGLGLASESSVMNPTMLAQVLSRSMLIARCCL